MIVSPSFIGSRSLLLGALTLVLTGSWLSSELSAEEPALEAGPAVALQGTRGRFDFIHIDRERLLAAHPENGTLDVIDLKKGELIKAVPTGAAQDCAVDAKNHRYLVSVSKPPQLAVVDAETLEVTGMVPLSGPADLLAFDEKTGLAYICHDDGKELWIVSPESQQVIGTVTLPSDGPEGLFIDAAGKRLFQAMKTASNIAIFDVATQKQSGLWPTAPAQLPHGIAPAPELNALLIAGGNGKLVLMSQAGGQILAAADSPLNVDEIAYDAGLHRVYCASGLGKIATYGVKAKGLALLGTADSSAGAHSIAVDPATHKVWVAYAKEGASYVQSFTPKP